MTEASEGANQADIWGKTIPDKEYKVQRLWRKVYTEYVMTSKIADGEE